MTEGQRTLSSARPDFHGGMGTFVAGGALMGVLLAAGLLFLLLFVRGARTFWPKELVEWELDDGRRFLVEETEHQADGSIRARTANRRLYNRVDFVSIQGASVIKRTVPDDAMRVERLEHGPFHGYLEGLLIAGESVSGEERLDDFVDETSRLRDRIGDARKKLGRAANRSDETQIAASQKELAALEAELLGYSMQVRIADGRQHELAGEAVLRVEFPNRYGFIDRVGRWFGALGRFIVEDPREANAEGGVWPALIGTSLMVLLMSILVVPFGVLAAVYLNEYAKDTWFVRLVRVAVNNLAGVPSIVFGVFGLGFLIYGVGGQIDRLFFGEALPKPTFGAGGVLWASVTMALLTVPVVVVATEEGLRSVTRDRRDGALALGATRWEMLRRVVLPGASPGILTGTILAVSRAAGEVAPLMLTGVVGFAVDLPVDSELPFLHLERRFMHLGYHIYAVGFQSPNIEAAQPLVYSTAALLLGLVLALNFLAISLRNRMRRSLEGR